MQTVPVAIVVVSWTLKLPMIVCVLACTQPFVDVTMCMFSLHRQRARSGYYCCCYCHTVAGRNPAPPGMHEYNVISYLSTGAGFLLSTAHLSVSKAQAGFLIFAATAAVPLSLLDAISVG